MDFTIFDLEEESDFIDPDEIRATSACTGKPWLDDNSEDEEE